MKKSKMLGLVLTLIGSFALTGCNSGPAVGPQGPQGETGETGPQGPTGQDGSSVLTGNGVPSNEYGNDSDSYIDLDNWDFYIKIDGSWILKGNIKGDDGADGQNGNGIVSIELTNSSGNTDTYTITFDNGETTSFTVTNGENGEQGIQGEPGDDGHTPVIEIGDNGNWVIDGIDTGISSKGEQGEKGDKGDAGEQGPQGEPGKDGVDGTSIYTLEGEPFPNLGKNGDSYIDLLSWNFYVKENGEWVIKGNIKGADGSNGSDGQQGDSGQDGTDGLSAYEIYIKYHPEYTGSEEEWIADLESGKLRVITIDFDSNGGSKVDSVITNFGSYISVEEPTKNGYDFVGWSLNGSLIDINTYVFFADCTLVAQWEESEYVSLSLNANGGVVVPGTLEVKYGEEYTLPTPSKAYQTFNCWNYEGQEIPTTGVWNYTHNDIELIAQWNTSNVYVDLEVDAEYGLVDTSRVTLTIGDYFTLPVPTSIKDGYTFNGWYLDDEKITDAAGNSLGICDFTETTSLRASYFIEIASIYDFMELGGQDLVGNYLITNDLDFRGLSVNCINSLNGTFDGNGHVLKNFIISSDSGLFKKFSENSSIQNVTFKNVEVQNQKFSGLIGNISSNSNISNIAIYDSFNSCEIQSTLIGTIKPENTYDSVTVNLENIKIYNSGKYAKSLAIYLIDQFSERNDYGQVHFNYNTTINWDGFYLSDIENESGSVISSEYCWFDQFNLKNYIFNGNIANGLFEKSVSNGEVYVSSSEIRGETESAWGSATLIQDCLLDGKTSKWGAEESIRCVDIQNEVALLELQNVFSSIFLSPDANGNYSYYSSQGELVTLNDVSLINKNLFVSFFGFSEEVWNLDVIDIVKGLYPTIRYD